MGFYALGDKQHEGGQDSAEVFSVIQFQRCAGDDDRPIGDRIDIAEETCHLGGIYAPQILNPAEPD
jgi:hypothetical protein